MHAEASETTKPTSPSAQWPFAPLSNPTVPPLTRHSLRFTNAIDRFVLEKQERNGTKLAPAADKRTLIRRASFDLTGLPPTPEEVETFLADKSRDAWPRVITRLLDSPRYGERWARHWLDVARFAESSGFEHDYDRPHAYHYRDFVIKALNADMPYDQFVRWQLAGDEFAPEEPLALMATGFLGAGVFPTQITLNEVERTRYDAMDDMLATTGTAMLGLTIGCARCHDHKFDPIRSEDYYRMLSTFTTTVRSELELDLQPEVYRRAKEEFDREHAPLDSALKAYEERELAGKFDAWLAAGAPLPSSPKWELPEVEEVKSRAGATFKKLDDGSYLAAGTNADADRYTFTLQTATRGLTALRLEALSHPSLLKGGPGRADNGNIGLSRIRVFAAPLTGGASNEVKLVRPRATFEQNTNILSIASALDDNAKTGWAIDPRIGADHAAVFEFERPVGFDGGTRLTVRLEFELNTRHNIGRPRLSVTTATNPGLDGDVMSASVAGALAKISSLSNLREEAWVETRNPKPEIRNDNSSVRSVTTSLNESDRATLLSWWKRSDPGWSELFAKVESHALQTPKPRLTKVMVCAEGHTPLRMHTQGADFFNETYVLHRGSTDLKRGVANQGFVQALLRPSDDMERWRWTPPKDAKFSGRRRTLANWMTDTDSGAGPLLARVMVNRLWQHHFGQGIVATPNDFGAQGTRPSHPELLDWLAGELIRNGWHLKPMHQLIMTSAAYQQEVGGNQASGASLHRSSVSDARLLPPDPSFAFPQPRRLEAEAIRDSLLFVSGVLDTNMFGPGTLDEGSKRRSIYFTVKRSNLVPSMQCLDAPEPLVSQGTRPTTTVAPQALMLMNSPHVRSWAGSFASRLQNSKDTSPAGAVRRTYSLAFNRAPTSAETRDGVAFIETQTRLYRSAEQPNARETALTDFAQAVLSLNEFVYVE